MTDQTAGIIGLVIFAVIFLFVGFWFGWSTILWIVGAAVVTFVGAALLKRFSR